MKMKFRVIVKESNVDYRHFRPNIQIKTYSYEQGFQSEQSFAVSPQRFRHIKLGDVWEITIRKVKVKNSK